VKSLNKQLTECDSEIEERTMKLQLLSKQLQIAKDMLDASRKKQQELKDKVNILHAPFSHGHVLSYTLFIWTPKSGFNLVEYIAHM